MWWLEPLQQVSAFKKGIVRLIPAQPGITLREKGKRNTHGTSVSLVFLPGRHLVL